MYLLVKRPSTGHSNAGKVVEIAGNRNNPPDDTILTHAVKYNGGVKNDYAIIDLGSDVDSVTNDRIAEKHDDFIIVWDADVPIAVDFSPEDDKPILKVTSDKSTIQGDGIQEVVFTFEIWKSDNSGIDRGQHQDLILDINSPKKSSKIKVNFVQGVGTKTLKTRDDGTWKILTRKPEGFKIDKQLNIDVYNSDFT